MKKYDELADYIIKYVGGKDNIHDLTHCMTRLRFKLNDDTLANEKKLNENTQVISVSHGGGRLQVIVGNSVGEIYDAIMEKTEGSKTAGDNSSEKKNLLTMFTDTITKIITPVLGCLLAVGLIKGILSLLNATGLIASGDGAYVILNVIGDSLFYFFPVILGYTSAETFGLNKYVGMLLGAVLIYPNITEALTGGDVIVSIFENTPFHMQASSTFFGIPVFFPSNGYSSTIIPIILITYFAAKVEKLLKKHIPDIVGFAVVPVLTLLLCAVSGILVIGPITDILSNIISWMTTSLYSLSPIIATIVIAMIYQPLVIFGLHWPLITLAMQNVGTLGYDYLWPMMYAASFAQTAVVMAVGLKTKDRKTKVGAVPAIISGLMCIIEPAIYGYTLPIKKRFAISCVSATIGGIIITATNSTIVGLANGILGFPVFIKPDGDMTGMFIAIGACVLTMILAFAATWITFDEPTQAADDSHAILSPVQGENVSLDKITDKTFKSEALGKTVAIYPGEGKIFAPCNGIVEAVFETGHALGIRSETGDELMIHIGIDTVQLNGKGFVKKIHQGDTVKKGDLLIEFDIDTIKNAGYSPEVFIVLSNSKDYVAIEKSNLQTIHCFDQLMTVV